MATLNSTIIESSWLSGTNDFQQRIPDPTIAGIDNTMSALFDPMNNDLYNAWVYGLVNRIGLTIVEGKRFTNPLGIFKRPQLNYGKTVQAVAFEWGKAHSYQDSAEDLLAYSRPEAVTAFVSANRFDKYKVSITRPEVRQAVAQDGYGLNEMIDGAVTANISNPEAYDEMNIMLELFAEQERHHGIYKHNVSAMPTDKVTGQEFLAAVKSDVLKLRFPSTLYNAQDIDNIPTFAQPEELVILCVPDVLANLDVYAFAEFFNVERAEVRVRVIPVPELPIANVGAILTTQDAFICCDTERGLYPFFDPNTLTEHSIYHAQGAYGINPFVPMIAYTTDEGTAAKTVTQDVTGITVTPVTANAKPGDTVKLTVDLTGTIKPAADGIEVKPDAATWVVTANRAAVPVKLNSRTYVDRHNVLHIQATGLEAGDVITATCTASYINPSGAAADHTASADITIQ